MSFIYENPWLINQLLQITQKDEKKFSKTGQVMSSTDVSVGGNLKNLLNNLKNQITPSKIDSNQIGNVADLFSHHMDSMGDLVEWLAKNGTTIGNKAIVYPGNTDRPGEEYGYYKIEPGTEIVVPLAKADRSAVAYWISADALKRYLISLQADPKLKNNVMFQVQLLKLVQDANKQLDTDINEQYKEPEQILPDNTHLDTLPPVFDPKQWNQSGNITLMLGDLKSPETLNAWYGKNNIAVKSSDGQTATIRDQNFDLCVALQFLAQRSEALLQRATPESKTSATAYVTHIIQISKQTNCSLSIGQIGQQNQKDEAGNVAILDELSNEQVFDVDYIDLNKIKIFADRYASWANRADMNALRDEINKDIILANDMLTARGVIQMTNMNIDSFRNLCKNGNQAKVLALTLDTIVNYAGRMMIDLANNIERNNSQAAQYLRQQVANGGPQQSNHLKLAQMAQLA